MGYLQSIKEALQSQLQYRLKPKYIFYVSTQNLICKPVKLYSKRKKIITARKNNLISEFFSLSINKKSE